MLLLEKRFCFSRGLRFFGDGIARANDEFESERPTQFVVISILRHRVGVISGRRNAFSSSFFFLSPSYRRRPSSCRVFVRRPRVSRSESRRETGKFAAGIVIEF